MIHVQLVGWSVDQAHTDFVTYSEMANTRFKQTDDTGASQTIEATQTRPALIALPRELQKRVLVHCGASSLALLEQSCSTWAPPAPRLSLIQETVRAAMRQDFPGAQRGIKSCPSLLQMHEHSADAAERWEHPAVSGIDWDNTVPFCEEMTSDLAVQDGEHCKQEHRAAMGRVMVAKLHQAVAQRSIPSLSAASDCIGAYSLSESYSSSAVAAGASQALVKVLWSDLHGAKPGAQVRRR